MLPPQEQAILVRGHEKGFRVRGCPGKIHHDPSAVRCGTAPGAARWGASPHAYPMNEGSAQVLACSLNHAVSKAGGAKAKNRIISRNWGGRASQYPIGGASPEARRWLAATCGWHTDSIATASSRLFGHQKARELGKYANSRRGGVSYLLYALLALPTNSASSRLNRSGSSRKGACPVSGYQDAVLARHFSRI